MMISFEDFKRLDIRVAKILKVSDHPNADKLHVLRVDWGDGEKTLVAGIKGSYRKEDLIDRQIIVLVNLEPANIRGVNSEGMLLACQDEEGISLISPDRKVKLGSQIR